MIRAFSENNFYRRSPPCPAPREEFYSPITEFDVHARAHTSEYTREFILDIVSLNLRAAEAFRGSRARARDRLRWKPEDKKKEGKIGKQIHGICTTALSRSLRVRRADFFSRPFGARAGDITRG